MRPALPSSLRNRVAIAAAVIGFVGFSAAAVLNQGIGRLAALPSDAKPVRFTDVELSEGTVAAADRGEGDAGEAPSTLPPPSAIPRAPGVRSYVESIVRRNIFDSTAVFDPAARVTDGGGECRDGGSKLLATVVAEPATWSSALIQASGRDAKSRGYAIGDDVSGEGRVVSIEQKRVCLDNGSCLCMGGEAAKVAATGGKPDKGDDTGITKLSDTKYQVDQSVIDDAMGNFEMLATQIKAYPHKGSDGQIDGFRLASIRPSSLFAKLGIKNGDIVHAVNGTQLTSAEGALSAYQSLKNERGFNFDITRKNQRQTMEYEVR